MKVSVISCNPSNEGKTFVAKIQNNKVVNVLGVNKASTLTYYISLPEKVSVGAEFDLNLNDFVVVEHPFEHPETGEILQLKWLHIK